MHSWAGEHSTRERHEKSVPNIVELLVLYKHMSESALV